MIQFELNNFQPLILVENQTEKLINFLCIEKRIYAFSSTRILESQLVRKKIKNVLCRLTGKLYNFTMTN